MADKQKKTKRFIVTTSVRNSFRAPWMIFGEKIESLPEDSITTTMSVNDKGEIKPVTSVLLKNMTEKKFEEQKNNLTEIIYGKLKNGTEYTISMQKS